MSEWIKCSDRLPEDRIWVLVWMPDDDFITVGYFKKDKVPKYIKEDGSYFKTDCGWEVEILWSRKGPITAWQELPKPPCE